MGKRMSKSTELAKREQETTALAPAPDYIGSGNEGLENMRPQDMMFPRARLMQPLSPEVSEGTAEAGSLIHSIDGSLIADKGETRVVVPIKHWLAWVEWGDRELNEPVKGFSMDPKSELARRAAAMEKVTRSNGKEDFAVTEYHNFLCVFIDRKNATYTLEDAVCFSLCRSNYKYGRLLLNLARMRGNKPLFAGAYTVKTEQEKNRRGQAYWVIKFANAGWAPEGVYKACAENFERLKTVTAVVDVTEQPDHEGATETEI